MEKTRIEILADEDDGLKAELLELKAKWRGEAVDEYRKKIDSKTVETGKKNVEKPSCFGKFEATFKPTEKRNGVSGGAKCRACPFVQACKK